MTRSARCIENENKEKIIPNNLLFTFQFVGVKPCKIFTLERGHLKIMRYDNGTTFVAREKEIKYDSQFEPRTINTSFSYKIS